MQATVLDRNDKFFCPTGDIGSPNKRLMLKLTKLRFPNEKTPGLAAKTPGQELRCLPTMIFRRIFLILTACLILAACAGTPSQASLNDRLGGQLAITAVVDQTNGGKMIACYS